MRSKLSAFLSVYPIAFTALCLQGSGCRVLLVNDMSEDLSRMYRYALNAWNCQQPPPSSPWSPPYPSQSYPPFCHRSPHPTTLRLETSVILQTSFKPPIPAMSYRIVSCHVRLFSRVPEGLAPIAEILKQHIAEVRTGAANPTYLYLFISQRHARTPTPSLSLLHPSSDRCP